MELTPLSGPPKLKECATNVEKLIGSSKFSISLHFPFPTFSEWTGNSKVPRMWVNLTKKLEEKDDKKPVHCLQF